MNNPINSVTLDLALGRPVNAGDNGGIHLEELRLQADQTILKGNWEDGRALHRLIDALERSDANESALETIASAAESLEDEVMNVQTALETFDSDFKSNMETLFSNLLDDLTFAKDFPPETFLASCEKAIKTAQNTLIKDFGELDMSKRGIGTVNDALKDALSDVTARKKDIETALEEMGQG